MTRKSISPRGCGKLLARLHLQLEILSHHDALEDKKVVNGPTVDACYHEPGIRHAARSSFSILRLAPIATSTNYSRHGRKHVLVDLAASLV